MTGTVLAGKVAMPICTIWRGASSDGCTAHGSHNRWNGLSFLKDRLPFRCSLVVMPAIQAVWRKSFVRPRAPELGDRELLQGERLGLVCRGQRILLRCGGSSRLGSGLSR
eukprot:scaffold1497_cov128-Isochrysis_galbana.AAC.4